MIIRALPSVITGLLGVVLAGVAVQGFVSVQAEVWGGQLAPALKAWKELLLVVAAGLCVVLISAKRSWHLFMRDWICWLVVGIGVVHIVSVLIHNHPSSSELAGLVIDLRGYLGFMVGYALLRLYLQARRALLLAGLAGAAVVVGFAILQVTVLPHDFLAGFGYSKTTIAPYLTVDLNYNFIRISSFLRGPNPLGAYMVIILAIGGAALCRYFVAGAGRKQYSPWFVVALSLWLLGAVVGLWFSYSRSAWLGAMVAAVVLAVACIPRRWLGWLGISLAVLTMATGIGVYTARNTPLISNLVFHNNAEHGSKHKSDDGHADSLRHASQVVSQAPLGVGVGTTGSPSLEPGVSPQIIENQYLYMAHETGWFGLGAQLVLFGAVMVRLWRGRDRQWLAAGLLAAGAGLAVIGLVLPVWADDTVVIYWWLLAGMALGSLAKK